MVGASDIIGKPLALALINAEATLTICNKETLNLAESVANAEILITAIGKHNVIQTHWLTKGVIVIDIGINRLEKKIVGDIDFEKALTQAQYITPVPGGVGPITIAMLMKNTLLAYKRQTGYNTQY